MSMDGLGYWQVDSMTEENTPLTEQLHRSQIHQRIALAKRNHPDCVVVYFVRHKEAPLELPRPTTPLLLFRRDMRIQEVMYALYEQIKYKGLAFYVLKSEGSNRVRYMMVQPGPTVGQVFDEFGKDDYLSLIYHNDRPGGRKITSLQRRIIRFASILFVIWVALYAYPYVMSWIDPEANPLPVSNTQEES